MIGAGLLIGAAAKGIGALGAAAKGFAAKQAVNSDSDSGGGLFAKWRQRRQEKKAEKAKETLEQGGYQVAKPVAGSDALGRVVAWLKANWLLLLLPLALVFVWQFLVPAGVRRRLKKKR